MRITDTTVGYSVAVIRGGKLSKWPRARNERLGVRDALAESGRRAGEREGEGKRVTGERRGERESAKTRAWSFFKGRPQRAGTTAACEEAQRGGGEGEGG